MSPSVLVLFFKRGFFFFFLGVINPLNAAYYKSKIACSRTRNSSLMKYFALVTRGSSPSSGVAVKEGKMVQFFQPPLLWPVPLHGGQVSTQV